MELIFIIGAAQAFFLPILIFNKKNRSTADYVLAFWLAMMGLVLLAYYQEVKGVAADYPIFLGFNTCLSMLMGPLTYIYVLSITRKDQPLNAIQLLHAIPYVFFTVVVFAKLNEYQGQSIEEARLIIEDSKIPVFMALGLTRIFMGSIYLVISFMLLKKHRKQIGDEFSYTRNINLRWLLQVVLAMMVIWITVIVMNVLGNFNDWIPMRLGDNLIHMVVTLAVFFGGFHGIKQQVIYAAPAVAEKTEAKVEGVESTSQYAKSSLRKDQSQELLKKLLNYMEDEKPFLDGKLSLNQVAQNLEISSNHLSQAINENLGKNFYDFVNGYRVEMVKQKIAEPANERFTLLAIAYDCGFSSKSSFNEVFKKFTGLTPSQYQKQLKP